MEDDIQNYLPTVMFRGTPCTFICIYLPITGLKIMQHKNIVENKIIFNYHKIFT